MKRIAVLLIGLLVLSCAAMQLSPEQTEYINIVNSTPLQFTVTKENIDTAWGRANSFIATYSSFKIQNANEWLIETYYIHLSNIMYAYKVVKVPKNNEYTIMIECKSTNMFMGQEQNRNAHILAYYIQTGNLPYPKMIYK